MPPSIENPLSNSSQPPLRNISDTARWVAAYRAAKRLAPTPSSAIRLPPDWRARKVMKLPQDFHSPTSTNGLTLPARI